MRYLCLILLIFNINLLYSENLNNYQIMNVKTINYGNKENEIGFDKLPEGPVTPLTFTVSSRNFIYVPDPVNKRINIFTNEMIFLKIIYEKIKGEAHWAEYISIDDEENIIYLNDYLGLRKINNIGEEIFTIRSYSLPKQIRSYKNLFILDKAIFYYNDHHEIDYYNEKGLKEKGINIIEKLQSLSESKNSQNDKIINGVELPEPVRDEIEVLKNDGKHLIVGNRFYSTCFRKHNEYYQKIRGVRLQGQDINEEKVKQEVSIDLDGYYLLFAGYDDANHSYWTAAEKASINGMKNQIIVVIDNLGELVDAFQYGKLENDIPQRNDYPASGAKVAIAPSGDVWFMAVSPEGYDFYRVDRQW